MHFAYPPRKDSHPAPFQPRRASIMPLIRRRHWKTVALAVLVIITLVWLFSGSKSKGPRPVSGKPPVVVVTVFDDMYKNTAYSKQIEDNRIRYARKHGYGFFIMQASDYDLEGAPSSWAKVVAMRHALAKFPDCKYVWYLDQHALIMNPNSKLEEDVLGDKKLSEMMLRNQAIVPPESVIHTFKYNQPRDVDVVLTQDNGGITTNSIILRNGEYAKYFLDAWFDPLYRSYNFKTAETHTLEHLIQWHFMILSQLAIIPQRAINAYSTSDHGAQYQDGDLAVVFAKCSGTGASSCASQAERFSQQWHSAFGVDN
ncbi:galactosyl transferase GMA12/MNN10 family-domain-containing protein [Astrocystis sublimbata]|nr:galactosyl transferase GMA12/MNN10 family-domain-containing protein [Astrocystis sublimbata]